MEFPGLESYIERACPEVLIDVNLCETLALYKKEHEDRNPLLLVDGDSCSDWLYDSNTLPGNSLGLYQELKLRWYQLISALEEKSIQPVFIFNGAPTCKTDDVLWVCKHNQKLVDLVRAKQEMGHGTMAEETKVRFLIAADMEKAEFSKFILREKGCAIMQTKIGTALELNGIANYYSHIGLLAQPTRFIGIETDVTLFSIKHLNMVTMDTKKYCRRALASHLGIDASYFPLLLTLCPNDIIPEEYLRDFHVSLFHEYNANRDFNSWSLPPSTITPPIEKVVEWINSQRLMPDPNTWVNEITRHPNLIEISKNIRHCLGMCFAPPSIMDPSENQPEILFCAEKRYRNDGMHGWIFSTMNRLECFCGVYYKEVFDSHTLLCSAAILQKLRLRMYGILLKDRTGEHSPVMTDHLLTFPGFTSSTVNPDFPDDHPGLLKLWEESTEAEQMKMMCWAVSDYIKLEDLLTIPPELRIACLSLFYIAVNESNYPHNANNLFLGAIIVVIIRLYKTPLLNFKRAECDEAPLFELYMANLYTQAWFHVVAVHDACGNPLLNDNKKVNSVFFDGKVFQTIMRRLVMGGTSAADLSNDLNLYRLITKFLWPEDALPVAGPSGVNDEQKKIKKNKGNTANETQRRGDADEVSESSVGPRDSNPVRGSDPDPSDACETRKKGKKKKGKTVEEARVLSDADDAGPSAGPKEERKKGKKGKGKIKDDAHGLNDADEAGECNVGPSDGNPTVVGPSDGPSDGSEARKKGKKKKGKKTKEPLGPSAVDSGGEPSTELVMQMRQLDLSAGPSHANESSDANQADESSLGHSDANDAPKKGKKKKKKSRTANEAHMPRDADVAEGFSTEPSLVMEMRQLNLGGGPSDANQDDGPSAGPSDANEARKKGKKKKGKSAKDPRGRSEVEEAVGPSFGPGDENQAAGPSEASEVGGSSAGPSNANETPKEAKKKKGKTANDERVLSEADEVVGPSSAPSDANQAAGSNDADEAGEGSDANKARKKKKKKKVQNK